MYGSIIIKCQLSLKINKAMIKISTVPLLNIAKTFQCHYRSDSVALMKRDRFYTETQK